jgi:hypothetical protein
VALVELVTVAQLVAMELLVRDTREEMVQPTLLPTVLLVAVEVLGS